MDFKELSSGRFTDQVSSGNQQPSLLPKEPNTPPYSLKNKEANLGRVESAEVYLPYGRQHAEKFGVKIVPTMLQALQMRHQKMAVITIREADILARWNVPLNSDFLHKALQAVDGMVVEGIPGETDNAFILREFYNRGIKFKKELYHKATKEQQDRADLAMGETLAKLRKMKLAAWPEEIRDGFAQELCKPEYMDWSQYCEAAKHTIIRDKFEDEVDVEHWEITDPVEGDIVSVD